MQQYDSQSRTRDLVYPSDAVRVGIGIREEIPTCLKRELDAPENSRVTVVINTAYPEISGGYYLNSRVINQVDRAFTENHIDLVLPDAVNSEICPIEPLIAVKERELCLLINRNEHAGNLLIWHFDAGGGGEFFSDDLVIDVVLVESLVGVFVNSLASIASAAQIRFERWGTLPAT